MHPITDPDGDREERLGQPERRDEQRAREEHQEPDRQVAPQDRQVEAAEGSELSRDRADPDRRCIAIEHAPEPFDDRHRCAPSAGMTRIRFEGSPARSSRADHCATLSRPLSPVRPGSPVYRSRV